LSASLQQTLLEERIAEARALRQRFSTCLARVAAAGGGADAAADAVTAYLATTPVAEMPLAAQAIWGDRVARPLKASNARPLQPKAVATIRSWPSSRVADLIQALREIETILAGAETDAMNEAIYAEISRAYS
jgi:hypothetical protein